MSSPFSSFDSDASGWVTPSSPSRTPSTVSDLSSWEERPSSSDYFDYSTKAGTPTTLFIGVLIDLIIYQQTCGVSFPSGVEQTAMQIVYGTTNCKGIPIDPYQGDCFEVGSHRMAELVALLQDTVPQTWQGDAADAYTAATSSLRTQAQNMADLDDKLQQIVADHADIVHDAQIGLGVVQDLFTAAYFKYVRPMESHPDTLDMAYVAIYYFTFIAVTLTLGFIGGLLADASATADEVAALGYSEAAAAAQTVIDTYLSAPDSASQSDESANTAATIDGDGSAFVSALQSSSTLQSSGWVAADSADVSGGLSTSSASGELGASVGVDSPQVATTPEQETSLTAASAMRVASQLGEPSGQAAGLAGGSASPGSRSDPRARRAAAAEADGAGQGEESGAGAGTPGAERAPIGVGAAGLGQASDAPPAAASTQ